jgi:acetyl-CoA acetyltransferase
VADRTPVIVGIAQSDYPKAPYLDAFGHHVQATKRVLADSGVAKKDIDGYVGVPMGGGDDAATMAEYLRINHRYIDGTMTGGSSFEFHMQHAAAAIRNGLCETVLVTYGSDFLSRLGRTLGTGGYGRPGAGVSGPFRYEVPYGNSLIGSYAMAARRHMHEFGTTSEQLAEIAVGVREYAGLNPNAMYRDPITVDDVVNSRMVADPLHKLDSCVVSDGGGALILTTAERARDLPQPPVYILGGAGGETHWNISQMPDFTRTAAAAAGPEAFTQAGITPADVDTVQLYDSFTITVLLLLEDLGFCPKGEGGRFVQEGHLRRRGDLPLNTDGGGLSSCHSGMRGIFLLIEAVRQLRHQAGEAQVPDARIAVAAGSGGYLSCIGVTVLGREHP